MDNIASNGQRTASIHAFEVTRPYVVTNTAMMWGALPRGQALADLDIEATLQGHRAAVAIPDHHTPLVRVFGAESKSLAGAAVGEITEIGRWKTKKAANFKHPVDHLYTDPTVDE